MSDSHVLPHGDFKKLDECLWILDGTLPFHMPLPRTMTVFRMKDGGLWIHSAIALNSAGRAKLESLGRPKILVVPSTMHRLDAPVYKALYPSIRVLCPEAARIKVEEKVPVDDSCENAFRGSEIIAHLIPGAKPIELAYELELAGGGKALIFNDLLVNVTNSKGLMGGVLKLIGRLGVLRSPPSNKLLLLDDRKKFRQWLETQAQRADVHLITVSHGDAVTRDIPRLLAAAARQV